MNYIQNLSRDEMRSIKAGESCTASVTCPNGYQMSCTNPDGQCYSEGNGTIVGYINCGGGSYQNACWFHDPEWDKYPEYHP